MSRIPLPTIEQAPAASAALLTQIQGAFGTVPAMFRAAANSPAALQALWGTFGALGGGTLPATLTEAVAVAIANRNGCHYCLAAHTALGRKAGASSAELTAAQDGRSDNPKIAAALTFALAVVDGRGQVAPATIDALRAAGFSDEAIVELLAHVALNLFTNYLNVAFEVPVDFPQVALRRAA